MGTISIFIGVKVSCRAVIISYDPSIHTIPKPFIHPNCNMIPHPYKQIHEISPMSTVST